MRVLKFGGSSVKDAERIKTVVSIVSKRLKGQKEKSCPIVVVVSAMQGVTDSLLDLLRRASSGNDGYPALFDALIARHIDTARALVPSKHAASLLAEIKVLSNELSELLRGVFLLSEASSRTSDLVVSFGERLSALIVAAAFNAAGTPAKRWDARELIITNDSFGNARADLEESAKLVVPALASSAELAVVTGFIGRTLRGDTTTLGRGGSDYTASIIGALLNVEEIEIWTDVDGMLTADPRKVSKAFSLPSLSYEEAMELCHFGAKVIYPPTLQPAFDRAIPIKILNTLNPEFGGTLIAKNVPPHGHSVTGISSIPRITLLRLQGPGLLGVAGICMRLFSALARRSISVIFITQASSEHTICFAVDPAQATEACKAINEEFRLELDSKLVEPVEVEPERAIVSAVGENMRHTPGISGTLFSALGRNGINVAAIAQGSSERNISVVISAADESKALNALHDAFFLSGNRTLNVAVVGTGLVGRALVRQLAQQSASLMEQQNLQIQLVGIANTKGTLIEPSGLPAESARDELARRGSVTGIDFFLQSLIDAKLPSLVLADCTASEELPEAYAKLLSHNIAVVTPNKRAGSGPIDRYKRIRETAIKRRATLLHETSVGAGLPVISTLNDLIRSGDKLLRIEAVLSGTLSFIFNNFRNGTRFSEVVMEAKARGYTEPDPRDDLSGRDVGRKLLILSREAGCDIELTHVSIESLVPEELRNEPSADSFLKRLPEYDHVFQRRREAAENQGQRLCYAASLSFDPGEGRKCSAEVSLKAVGPSHPFFGLSGSDNIVSFTTERYMERPLVVRGPGAGAEVTAAGVLADIIRIGMTAI